MIRAVFSRKEEAADALRSMLSQDIASAIDWGTLRLVNAHFRDEALRKFESDLVYVATFGGSDLVLYVLFEHQSTVDRLMPFRVVRYMVRVWEAWLADHKHAKSLPPILPVVLSHAEQGWSAPVSMSDLYDLPDSVHAVLLPHLPTFSFVLDDLRAQRDQDLMKRAMSVFARFALLVLRNARHPSMLINRLLAWPDELRALHALKSTGVNAFNVLMRYVLLVTEGHPLEDIARRVEPVLGQSGREQIMSLGEELIAEGKSLGLAEGHEIGRAEGKATAIIAFLEARGLSISPSERKSIRACRDAGRLDRWIAKAAKARSTAELLSDG